MQTTQPTDRKTADYLPVHLETLQLDSVLEFDLYLKTERGHTLFRSRSQPFTEKTRSGLTDNQVNALYVSPSDRHQYQRYLESNLGVILNNTSMPDTVKAGIVYDCSRLLIRDIFDRPSVRKNILRGQELVESTVGFVLTNPKAFQHLLGVMSFDYTTYSHSVNVCTFALALAQFTGLTDPVALKALGTGALLHDIGKTRIPEKILHKLDPLTDAEMELIKLHPQWGHDIIRETAVVDQDSYHPIVQHHEREDESGYPSRLSGKSTHHYSKITAIADVFDAMTTKRVYRGAVPTFPALKEMFADEGLFDRELLEQFARMMGPGDVAEVQVTKAESTAS